MSDSLIFVSDGESGIQGKEISTITKRKLDLLYSTSAMKKGSNQNMAESKSVFLEGTGFHTGKSCAIDLNSPDLLKVTNINGGRDKHENLASCADSQGENQPIMPQVCMPDEGISQNNDLLYLSPRRAYFCFGNINILLFKF